MRLAVAIIGVAKEKGGWRVATRQRFARPQAWARSNAQTFSKPISFVNSSKG